MDYAKDIENDIKKNYLVIKRQTSFDATNGVDLDKLYSILDDLSSNMVSAKVTIKQQSVPVGDWGGSHKMLSVVELQGYIKSFQVKETDEVIIPPEAPESIRKVAMEVMNSQKKNWKVFEKAKINPLVDTDLDSLFEE